LAKIFICYRREDSAYPAHQIHDALTNHFGSESVIFDVHSIPYGIDFREYLKEEVSKCDIFLAVIGDQWIDILKQRLDEPNDFVRIEIQVALGMEIPVIPILIGKAAMPIEKHLPPEFSEIAFMQAAEMRAGPDLQTHLERLISGLERRLSDLEAKKELKRKEIDFDVLSNQRQFAQFAELGGEMGQFDLTAAIKAKELEKLWGDTGYQSLEWLLQAIACTRSMAKLGPKMGEMWRGSGYLVDGSWIDDSWSDRKLLLTNAWTCTDDKDVQAQYPYPREPEYYKVTFLGSFGEEADSIQIDVKQVLWTSPPSKLNASLLEIADVPKGVEKVQLAAEIPTFDKWPEERVYLLGHPWKEPLISLSHRVLLHGNYLNCVDERYLRYMKPTHPISSGSQIFNHNWELVGIQRSFSKKQHYITGVRIDSILEEIRNLMLS
jgi:hypothetical protein